MALYVDGFVIPIPKKNLQAYKKIATLAKKVWMEYGALSYVEAAMDDEQKFGTPFGKLTKKKPSETVIFAFITFKSKAERNRINKLVMKDPRLNLSMKMPFDMKRMTVAGFKGIVVG